MVGTKWIRVTLGDPIWADAYNLALPSSATQMVRGARCRTKGGVCKETEREEGGTVTTGDDDRGLHGRSVRVSQHGVKEAHVCDVSLAGWSRLGCVCLQCGHITGCGAVTDRGSVVAPLKGDTRVASLTTGCPVH